MKGKTSRKRKEKKDIKLPKNFGKTKAKPDRIVIERVGVNKKGEIVFLDVYDNKLSQAVFLEARNRH